MMELIAKFAVLAAAAIQFFASGLMYERYGYNGLWLVNLIVGCVLGYLILTW